MLLIYTPTITNRIRYIFDLFFKNILKTDFEITSDKQEFLSHTGAKFSYAQQPLADELFFKQSKLLIEKTIVNQQLNLVDTTVGEYKLKGFYGTVHAAFPFDVFASAFYLVSRYEEYVQKDVDRHNRFKATDSAAFRFQFLKEPMIDFYALALRDLLLAKFPTEKIETTSFKMLNTIDVDLAYKYLHKKWWLNLGGFLRDFSQQNFAAMKERIWVLLKWQPDPFQTFEYIEEQAAIFDVPFCFFWQLGDRQGDYDKNTSHIVPEFRALIAKFADKSGIHLSYSSHAKTNGFSAEINRLSEIISVDVNKNRFHYLKMKISEDYRKLINAGISEDYTVGYAAHEGFRASIARPFLWFDLGKDEITNLTLVPFMFMDAPFRDSNLSAKEIKVRIEKIIVQTQKANGILVALWHNNTFAEPRTDWKDIFEWFNQRVDNQ
ncbi:MAG TPA: hypothetical protein VGB95_02800 [Chitinophagales bacterium]